MTLALLTSCSPCSYMINSFIIFYLNSINKTEQGNRIFNPSFCSSVETNVGRMFLSLIKKHFHKNNQFNKILNKNTIKLSYSCMENMKSIINSHNNTILRKLKNGQNKAIMKDCNCRDKAKCPLQGKCLSKNNIYKATV